MEQKGKLARMDYHKPPIVEATVQISFSAKLSDKDVDSLALKFGRHYGSTEKLMTHQFSFDATGQTSTTSTPGGYRLTSKDATDVLVLEGDFIVTALLAPYQGWLKLRETVLRNFNILKKHLGPFNAKRLGMRYINRIDVPYDESGKVDLRDFVTVYPNSIDFGDDWQSRLVQVSLRCP